MRSIKGIIISLGLFALLGTLHAQLAVQSIGDTSSEVFSDITLQPSAPERARPISMNAADMQEVRRLNDTQLNAFLNALAATPQLLFKALPKRGRMSTFYSLQHPEWPPLPCNGSGLPVWQMQDFYLLNDVGYDYNASTSLSVSSLSASTTSTAMSLPVPGGGGSGSGTNLFQNSASSYTIDTNGLWIEVASVDTGQYANLLVHNTSETNYYQLLSKTNLAQPNWILGPIKAGDYGTNQTAYDYVSISDNPMMFFRAQRAGWRIYIEAGSHAVEPYGGIPGQDGTFYLYGSCDGVTNDLTVRYILSGTATTGVDYTNLSGVVTLTNVYGSGNAEISLSPKADILLEGGESITLTLVPTNGFLIIPGQDAATIRLLDSSTTVGIQAIADAFGPDGPPHVSAWLGSFQVWRSDFRGIYTNNLTVRYQISGTASNGVDYALLSGAVTFKPDMSDTNIVITPLKDSLPGGLETVTLTLIPTNTYLVEATSSAATVSIYDSSTTVSLGIFSYYLTAAIEPDGPPSASAMPASFRVQRSDSRNIYTNLAVRYVVGGTASNGVDYVALSGIVNFAPDMTETNIVITPLKDNLPEGLETMTVTLLDATTNGYFVDGGSLTGTVTINDTSTTVSLSVFLSAGIEPDGPPGAPAEPVSFRVWRADSRGIYTNLAVRYAIGGTASNGVDYVSLTGMVNFLPGMTDTNIVITPLADYLIESPETVTVTLLDASTNGFFIDTNNLAGTVALIDTSTSVSISAKASATEPYPGGNTPLQPGYFQVSRSDWRSYFHDTYTNLTVFYQISGTASNGVDYLSLTGSVTFAPGKTTTNIYIQPLSDFLVESNETVTFTLIPNSTNADGYAIASNAATINIVDNSNMFAPVASLRGPVGIDYHAPSNSLIVSYNFDGGNPYVFARIYTNASTGETIVTNWSGVSSLVDEVKLATVKVTTNGFTAGETFFGHNSVTKVGKLSADGTVSNLNFATLTNDYYIRGSLYVDQTGIFSNQVIAVTSGGTKKGIWRVNAQGTATMITNISTSHLEGVITLPNDTNKWGPWAGKIITGDETAQPYPLIYTIATNGIVQAYNTTNLIAGGIRPEDFDIIPPNQDLYACDPDQGKILKLSKGFLTNYVGDLLITDAGEYSATAKLFIVHWNSGITNFETHSISYRHADGSSGHFEHVTFAPIELQPK